ncbi:hypothetical protein D3C78_460760 [compost metagenome]
MDVAAATDCRGVAQAQGDLLDGVDDLSARLALRLPLQGAQAAQGQGTAGPGTIVLGREVAAGQLLQEGVDVGRTDTMALTKRILILKQVLAGQVHAALDQIGQATIAQGYLMFDSALAAKAEAYGAALDLDVAVAQGGQAEGVVVAGILTVANTDQGGVEQADHQGHDFFPVQSWARQLAVQLLAQFRQCIGEGQHARVFVAITKVTPQRVIAVLLAPASVASGGLQVTLRVSADPHVGIGRRHGQGLDTLQGDWVADALAIGIDINKACARFFTAQARLVVVNIVQASGQGSIGHGAGPVTGLVLWTA